MELKNIEEILGGYKNLKVNISNNLDLMVLSEIGVTKKSIERFSKLANIRMAELANLLPISLRSIQRYTNSMRFSPLVSEKFLQIAKIYLRGVEVFGNSEKFLSWLHSENYALGGRKPLVLLSNAFGYEMVENELGRIEHGIFA